MCTYLHEQHSGFSSRWCRGKKNQPKLQPPKLWDEDSCFETMIVRDFLVPCGNMLLAGITWTLPLHLGWFRWVLGLHYFSLSGDWLGAKSDRRAWTLTRHPTIWTALLKRVFPQNWLTHSLSFPYLPTKAEMHQLKTCSNVMSKIGLKRICCVKSL